MNRERKFSKGKSNRFNKSTLVFRLNKKVMKVSFLNENDEKEYWLSRTPLERLKAIEINRRIVYGYAHTSPRFQRFFEVAELKSLKNKKASGRHKDLNDLENLR